MSLSDSQRSKVNLSAEPSAVGFQPNFFFFFFSSNREQLFVCIGQRSTVEGEECGGTLISRARLHSTLARLVTLPHCVGVTEA